MSELRITDYNNDLWSIRDLDCEDEVHFSEAKWDPIFEPLRANTCNAYFMGSFKNYNDDAFEDLIALISDDYIVLNKKIDKIVIKIKLANLLISRVQIEKIWLFYEHAALFFFENEIDEDELLRKIKAGMFYEEIVDWFTGSCVLYKGRIVNLVWLKYS